MNRIPITILTGFLGAGKTTLLNRLISEPDFGDTAIIINEFGEAAVDGALVAHSDERAFALSVGCLCCTVSGDVRLTLLRLLDEAERGIGPAFDRVVIETTGLADPIPILQAFMTNDFLLSRFTLNGVVTLVDAVNGQSSIDRFVEAQRQIAVADLLLVTKSDLAKNQPERVAPKDMSAVLARRNPNAVVMPVEDATARRVFSLAAFDPKGVVPDVAEWLRFEDGEHSEHHTHHHDHDHGDVNNHGDAASAFCFTAEAPVDPQALDAAIRSLVMTLGPDLLRVKGLVELLDLPDTPRVVHVAGHVVSPAKLLDGWPDGVDQTTLVMIVGGDARDDAKHIVTDALPALRPFKG